MLYSKDQVCVPGSLTDLIGCLITEALLMMKVLMITIMTDIFNSWCSSVS